MSQSLNEAITALSQNQLLLSKQIAQVATEQQISQLNTVINTQFTTISTTLTSQQAEIDQLNGLVAMNPIPNFSDSETPTGAINGTNPTFLLANTPIVGSVALYVGATPTAYGQLALQSVHYIIANNVITFQSGFIPAASSWIRAFYRY